MKIGITGVAGFIGSNLADALIAEGHRIVGVDSLVMGTLDNLKRHEGSPSRKRAQFLKQPERNICGWNNTPTGRCP